MSLATTQRPCRIDFYFSLVAKRDFHFNLNGSILSRKSHARFPILTERDLTFFLPFSEESNPSVLMTRDHNLLPMDHAQINVRFLNLHHVIVCRTCLPWGPTAAHEYHVIILLAQFHATIKLWSLPVEVF